MKRLLALLILSSCWIRTADAATTGDYDAIIEAIERETFVEQKKATLEEAKARTAELAEKRSFEPETFDRPVLVAIYGNERWMRAVFARSASSRFHAGVGELVGDDETIREIHSSHVVIADHKGKTRTIFLGDAKGSTERAIERPRGIAPPAAVNTKTP